jgi:AraC-like DNA-binding protein
MPDAISPILDMIGVKGAVYFQTDFCAPWGMDVADTGFAQFHMVISGEAILRQADGTQTSLSSGDLVVYPTGGAHAISDSAESPTRAGQEIVGAIMTRRPVFAGDGRRTRLICGHFSYDLSHRHPLVAELPDQIILRSSEILGAETLLTLLRLIITETNQPKIGSETIVQRLSDAVFVAILRAHIIQTKPTIGFLAALRDPRLAHCIAAIHTAFPQTPALDVLARTAGMSRSSLASIFKRHLGFGPGEYAVRWKLLNAAQMLTQSDETIELVSFTCGYHSPSSFSRAFRNFFGQAASEYRDIRRSSNANSAP